MPRVAEIVRAGPAAERPFGGDDRLLSAARDRLPEHFLGASIRVHVGGIEHVDAGFETDVHEPGGFCHVARTPRLEELVVAAAEGPGAEAEQGDFEARVTKSPEFHRFLFCRL